MHGLVLQPPKIFRNMGSKFLTVLQNMGDRLPTLKAWLPAQSHTNTCQRQNQLFVRFTITQDVHYPEKLAASVGRACLSRPYSPLPNSIHGLRAQELQNYLTELGCKVGTGRAAIPARAACARAGIVTYGLNNFAYADGCGSFILLYTHLVDTELE